MVPVSFTSLLHLVKTMPTCRTVEYDLPFVQLVDGKGELTKETPYAGVFVKKADPMVLKDLDEKGLLI